MAGTSNFLTFDAPGTNAETDAQYANDSLRINGAPQQALLPSATFNKFAMQVSTFVAAFGEMLANKGYAVSDASQAALAGVLANVITAADQTPLLQLVPYSPTISLNARNAQVFYLPLTGNANLSVISNAQFGQEVTLIWQQDAAGGRVVTYPGYMELIAPDQTPNAVTVQSLRWDGYTNTWRTVGPAMSNIGAFFPGNAYVSGYVQAASANIAGAVQAGSANIPGAAKFGSIALESGAPAGQVLVGNGTSFVPAVAPGYSSGSSAYGYWQKDPNGLIRQWGQVTTDINGGTLPVSFPINFSNTSSVAVTVTTDSPTDRITYVVNGSLSASGFTIGNNGSSGYAYWQAIGY